MMTATRAEAAAGFRCDSEGHSEASRRGWERSDHGEQGPDDDRESDRRLVSRSRDDDDRNDGRSRGWFGDFEGHSETSRRGWEDGHRLRMSRR